MMKYLLLPAMLVFLCFHSFADKGNKSKKKNETVDSVQQAITRYLFFADSVSSALKYQTGAIGLGSSKATLNVPPGFRFINAEQSKFVISKVWGNPDRDDILGIILPAGS